MSVHPFGQLADSTAVMELRLATAAGAAASIISFGATAGHHASRIAGGRLRLDGVDHQLTPDDSGRHDLHCGTTGFSHRPWQILAADEASVVLGLVSPDGDQGYPGTVEARCTYSLVQPATLREVTTATADPCSKMPARNSARPGTMAIRHFAQG